MRIEIIIDLTPSTVVAIGVLSFTFIMALIVYGGTK